MDDGDISEDSIRGTSSSLLAGPYTGDEGVDCDVLLVPGELAPESSKELDDEFCASDGLFGASVVASERWLLTGRDDPGVVVGAAEEAMLGDAPLSWNARGTGASHLGRCTFFPAKSSFCPQERFRCFEGKIHTSMAMSFTIEPWMQKDHVGSPDKLCAGAMTSASLKKNGSHCYGVLPASLIATSWHTATIFMQEVDHYLVGLRPRRIGREWMSLASLAITNARETRYV